MTDRNLHWGELLRRARRGDQLAYARFLSEVTPAIRTVVRARARGDEAAVEDIVQEVLLGLHAKRHTWNEDAPVTPWLYAIARYKAADALRARRLRRTDPLEDHAEGLVDDTLGDPTAARDLGRLLEGIDTRSAGIVRSLGVEGESAGEVGARLGLSEGAVRVAYHRAMTRLRRIARGPEAKPEAKDD